MFHHFPLSVGSHTQEVRAKIISSRKPHHGSEKHRPDSAARLFVWPRKLNLAGTSPCGRSRVKDSSAVANALLELDHWTGCRILDPHNLAPLSSLQSTYLYLAFPSPISTIALFTSFIGRFTFHVLIPFFAAKSSIYSIVFGLPIALTPIIAPFAIRLKA